MKILHLSRYRTGNREYAKEITSFTTEYYTDKHNVKNVQIDKNEPVSGRSGGETDYRTGRYMPQERHLHITLGISM